MLSHVVSPEEWLEFENVYQIHCLKIYMDNAVRDVCSMYIIFASAVLKSPEDHDTILLLLSCLERA